MASGTDEALQVDAMKKLAYLCNCFPEEILNRTIPILAKVLGDNDSFDSLSWRYLLEILSALTLMREVRTVLSSLRGLRFLVEAAHFGILVDLFRVGDSTTKVVAGNSPGVISVHVDYIRLVAEAGAILLYAELLQVPDFIGKEIAEDVFCVLAVAKENAVSIAEHLVRILREGDDESKPVSADVFCDLSDYKHSIHVVRSSGAIPIPVNL
ncbi:hypothetical protein LWI29_023875 [Acer saccharum]|uniref:Uncharacterized protein n=1 Tax=Acer saccharum TaxID=4024 RepID=A0AA39T4P1_ACESA|nr:hypothetical protein LWI29_023875 [Acer saccharum]